MGATQASFPGLVTDSNGSFNINVSGLPNGTYTWWVKGAQSLANSGTVVLNGSNTTQEMGLLRTGDTNNDNLVDLTDFNLVRAAYGKSCGNGGYDARAEFTGDCVVDITDFTLMRGSYGMVGAPAPVVQTPTNTPSPTRTSTAAPTNTATRTATNTATRTPTRTATLSPTAVSTPSGACPIFPADNIWNRNIASAPVHARSADYITNIGVASVLHPDFAAGSWQGETIGIPFIEVPGTQPRVPITFDYANESDPGPYPFPTNAPIQGGPTSIHDRHVVVIDRDACVLYETYKSYPNADGSWHVGSGAKWNLNSNALRPNGWTSSDAAGLPLRPGLVTYDEVNSGVIRHAIRFTTVNINRSYVWPARHSDGQMTDPAYIPMGTRLRLKASVNISGFTTKQRVILQALKDYGMILADTGDALNITGAPDSRWNDVELNGIEALHASDFEAIDESGLMVDPNSGQSR
jgi:hypothetical protein